MSNIQHMDLAHRDIEIWLDLNCKVKKKNMSNDIN